MAPSLLSLQLQLQPLLLLLLLMLLLSLLMLLLPYNHFDHAYGAASDVVELTAVGPIMPVV